MQLECEVCGYIHDDSELPEVCPICGAPKSKFFERYDDENALLDDALMQEERDDRDDFYYGEYDE